MLTSEQIQNVRRELDSLETDVSARDVSRLQGVYQRVFADMDEIMDGAEGRNLLASEQREYDRRKAIVDQARGLLTKAQADARSLQDAPPVEGGRRANASGISSEERALRDYLVTGDPTELRAMGVSTDTAGGYAVPEGFRDKIQTTLKAFGGVTRVAEILTTDDGRDLPWPTMDDTGNAGEILPENTAATEQDVTLGQNKLAAYAYSSKIVRVSRQLLQDNGVSLESRLGGILGQRIGRAIAPHLVTGTGTSQPDGLVTSGTVGVTGATGQTTSVTYDDLVDLESSVDSAYLENPDECAWVMHGNTWAAVRKLTDGNQRPLLDAGLLATGADKRLLGYRVVIDPAMATMTASAKSIAFGNFRHGYIVRFVGPPSVLRMDERYGDLLQVGFLGFQRADGMVQDASAYRLYQNAAS